MDTEIKLGSNYYRIIELYVLMGLHCTGESPRITESDLRVFKNSKNDKSGWIWTIDAVRRATVELVDILALVDFRLAVNHQN